MKSWNTSVNKIEYFCTRVISYGLYLSLKKTPSVCSFLFWRLRLRDFERIFPLITSSIFCDTASTCCNAIIPIIGIGLEVISIAFLAFKKIVFYLVILWSRSRTMKTYSEKEFVLHKFSVQSNYLNDFISTIFKAKNEFCAMHQMLVKNMIYAFRYLF